MKQRNWMKRLITTLVIFFVLINVIAIFQAYQFTHFDNSNVLKTRRSESISTSEKLKALVFGVNNPRPVNKRLPAQKFETLSLQSNKRIECWYIPAKPSKGTIILFHGYGGEKSSMLDKSDEFIQQSYSTLLVDFMGSGNSEGDQTTIGYKEAAEVKTAYDYVAQTDEKNIYLFGTSMGAVAILKAINDYHIQPKGIIFECPFGSLYQTTCARFHILHIPVFPMAALLVFWGGVENGFPAFQHNPTEYAKAVTCPALLLYGGKDNRVSREEINDIYNNLKGKKELRVYPLAGHEDYLVKYKPEWLRDVNSFLQDTTHL